MGFTMRVFSFLIIIFLTACSGEDQVTGNGVGTQSDDVTNTTDSQHRDTGWFEDKRVTQYLAIMEKSLNVSSLFYSRISPAVAQQIKKVTMPPEAKEVAQCLVGKVKENNMEKQFDQSMELTQEYFEYIENTPGLTLLNLDQDSHLQSIQEKMSADDFNTLQTVSNECGVMEMNIKATRSTGIMDAMKAMREIDG
jgi:hypothetical protein